MIVENKEVAASLRRAGIGDQFHELRMGEVCPGLGDDLREWIIGNWGEVRQGAGATLVGDDLVLDKLMMLCARTCHLHGLGALITSPVGLANRLRTEDWPEQWGALFVRRFVDAGEFPLRPWQREAVEDFLTECIWENIPCFFRVVGGEPEAWWSRAMVQLVAETNREFRADGV